MNRLDRGIPMAEVNDKLETASTRHDERRDLPSLIERLAGDVSTLFDQKLSLLRIEIKEEVDAYVRGSIFILAGGVVAVIGFGLANIALAFLVSTLFANAGISQPAKYALGFVVTGIAYLLIGGAVIVLTKNRLAKQGIVPRRTMQELERDKEWLQEEL
jgi:uncharacterized membrane protein YqjE